MAERKIHHWGMITARLIWLVIVLSALALWGSGLLPRYQELQIPCNDPVCPLLSLTSGEIDLLQEKGFSLQIYADIQVGLEIISVLAFAIPGGLIFWRRSDDRVGYLFSLALILIGTSAVVNGDDALQRAYPSFLFVHGLLTTLSTGMILIMFIFPDGQFVPKWSRYFILLGVIILLLSLIGSGGNMEIFYSIGIWQFIASSFVIGSLLLGAFAQIYRFRYVSGPTEQQQTKWVVLGISAMFAGITTWILFIEVFPLPPGINRMLVNLVLVTIVSMFNWIFPITVTLAILRYRLWDIDIIVRRTLQYTLLTGILVLVYFGSVILLQSLTENLFGEQSPLVIVLSTLAIAALFNPLRTRIQDFIDRRFYRKKYNAEKALTEFAATARDEVELDKLTAALLRVVDESVQPEVVSLWLEASPYQTQPGEKHGL